MQLLPRSIPKCADYTYYDQVWVYSAFEAFKYGIYKEDFAVISNLQRLDIITALEKPEPIQLSLRNQIMTSEDEDSTNSDDSDSDNPPAPRGDKVTKQILPHRVSSKSRTADLVESINHLGARFINFDAVVSQIAENVKNQTIATSAYISSIQESQNDLIQWITILETNQTTILENQLCHHKSSL